jgi:hypothetical protein
MVSQGPSALFSSTLWNRQCITNGWRLSSSMVFFLGAVQLQGSKCYFSSIFGPVASDSATLGYNSVRMPSRNITLTLRAHIVAFDDGKLMHNGTSVITHSGTQMMRIWIRIAAYRIHCPAPPLPPRCYNQ